MRLAVAVLLLSALALAACSGSGSSRDASTCSGCCDANGICESGLSPSACGAGGAACSSCGGSACVSGVCGGGGNGGSTSSNGGSTEGVGSSSGSSGSIGGDASVASSSSGTDSTGSTGDNGTTGTSSGSTSSSGSSASSSGASSSTGGTPGSTASSSSSSGSSSSGSTGGGVCTVGAKRCDPSSDPGTARQVCGSNGQWQADSACSSGTYCGEPSPGQTACESACDAEASRRSHYGCDTWGVIAENSIADVNFTAIDAGAGQPTTSDFAFVLVATMRIERSLNAA